jgi:hypothetical protein
MRTIARLAISVLMFRRCLYISCSSAVFDFLDCSRGLGS